MNLIIGLHNIDAHTIYFEDPQPNIVMSNGEFSRLLFSNNLFTTIGVLASLSMQLSSHSIYFNKHRLYFDTALNEQAVDSLIRLERIVLENFYKPDKSAVYRLKKQLADGFIRIYSEAREPCLGPTSLLIKVSGVWCTENEYGITFKFILPHS